MTSSPDWQSLASGTPTPPRASARHGAPYPTGPSVKQPGNAASLRLAPDQVADIAGLRGTFRQSGAITAVAVTTAFVARSAGRGLMRARVFLVFAALLLATLPLAGLVPDHHGNW